MLIFLLSNHNLTYFVLFILFVILEVSYEKEWTLASTEPYKFDIELLGNGTVLNATCICNGCTNYMYEVVISSSKHLTVEVDGLTCSKPGFPYYVFYCNLSYIDSTGRWEKKTDDDVYVIAQCK